MSDVKRARTLKRQDTPSSENFMMEEWPVVFVKGASMPVPVGPPLLKQHKKCVRIYATCPWLQKIAFGHAAYQQHEAEYTRSVITKIRALANAAHSSQASVIAEASQAPVIQDDDLAGLDAVSDDPDSQGSQANSQGSDIGSFQLGCGRLRRNAVWVAVDLDDVPLRVLLGKGVTIFDTWTVITSRRWWMPCVPSAAHKAMQLLLASRWNMNRSMAGPACCRWTKAV